MLHIHRNGGTRHHAMGMFMATFLEKELSRIGAMQILEKSRPEQAAQLAYQWLVKEMPLGGKDPSIVYEMLSSLIDRGETFGFTYKTAIESGRFVFTITNTNQKKNGMVQILLELLLALIFERHGQFESEIVHSGNDTIVRIRPPKA